MEVAWDTIFSHKTGYFHMGGPQEIISCLLSHEKISCLMRFSHGIYKEGMRHEIFSWDRRFSCGEGPPRRKSPVSWDNLMSHEIFFWDLWRKHETLDFLMRQEKISCLTRFSHGIYEKGMTHEIFLWDRRFSCGEGPPMRISPVSCLMR